MVTYKIEMDRLMCISCGNCVETCPDLWEMAEDGLSNLKNSEFDNDIQKKEIEDLSCSLEAAEKCPVLCITIFEDGAQLI